MLRKVVQQGPATLMVSLPKKWVERYGVKKGQEVHVEAQDHQLLVATDTPARKEKSVTLAIDDWLFAYSYLRRAYRHGYTDVMINYPDEAVAGRVKELVANLFGADILDQTDKTFRIKITDPDMGFDVDKELVRCLRSLKEQLSIIRETFCEQGTVPAEKLMRDYYFVIQRLDYFLRQSYLSDEGFRSHIKIPMLGHLHELQRQIGFYFVLAEKKVQLPIVKNKDKMKRYWTRFLSFLDRAMTLLQSDKKADVSIRKEIRELQYGLINDMSGDDASHLFIYGLLLDYFDKFNEFLIIYKNEKVER